MRLQRVRFKVRQLMALVALVALSLATATWTARFINGLNQGLRDLYGPGGVLDRQAHASGVNPGGSIPRSMDVGAKPGNVVIIKVERQPSVERQRNDNGESGQQSDET